MIRTHDIHSLTDFQRNTREHVERLKETGRPAVLTVNGKAEVVVQSAQGYQELLDRLDHVETVLAILRSNEEAERGETIPAEEVFRKLREIVGERRSA